MTPTTLLIARTDEACAPQRTAGPEAAAQAAPIEGLSLVSPAWTARRTDDDDETDTLDTLDSLDRAAPVGVPVGLGLPVVRSFMTPEELEAAAWQDRALCSQTDPEAFFPEKGGSTREAKRVCLGCEVRTECLEYALTHDERFGIWGGLSERERRRVKREAV